MRHELAMLTQIGHVGDACQRLLAHSLTQFFEGGAFSIAQMEAFCDLVAKEV